MGVFKVNISQFRKDILRSAGQFKGWAYGAIKARFDSAKKSMINEFVEHDVTKEIAAGPHADPDSGVVSGGNLFSYIGFYEGSDPVAEVVNTLEEETRIAPNPSLKMTGNLLNFGFSIHVPTRNQLTQSRLMPWVNRSWLYGIEEGISGVGNYLFFYYPPSDISRSSTAIQDKRELKRVTFRPRRYISDILGNFKKKF